MAEYWWQDGWWLLWMLPLFIVILFAVVLVRDRRLRMRRRGGSERHTASAREILDRRFAKGEISRQQYEEMKTALHH